MAMTFTHQGKLFIVLDQENIHRIQQNDPFEFDQRMAMRAGPTALRFPLQITIAFARVDELDKITKMATTEEVVAYLQRGYQITGSDMERGNDAYEILSDALARKDDSTKQ